MYRGTTPTICFTLMTSLDLSLVSEVYVTLQTYVHEVTFTKERVRIDADSSKLYITLTQEETLAFETGKLNAQARLLFMNGSSFATEIVQFEMKKILLDGVIKDEEHGGDDIVEGDPDIEPIAMVVEEGNEMGGEGSSDYTLLRNKPKLNGVTLVGTVSLNDIGLAQLKLSEVEKMFKGW